MSACVTPFLRWLKTLAPGLLVTLFYPLLARLNLHLGHLILPGLLAAATFAASLALLGRVADRAVQIHGGSGYMSEYAVERFYRDVRLFRIFEGTSQIQQLVIARETIKAHS